VAKLSDTRIEDEFIGAELGFSGALRVTHLAARS
jgi:hypothetical protein